MNNEEAKSGWRLFPNLQAIGDPLFPDTVYILRAQGPSTPPAFWCHRDILWQRNDTNIKGKVADFFAGFTGQ